MPDERNFRPTGDVQMSGMIEHPELLLSAYLDGALSQGDHDTVRAHLDGCDRCRAQLADLRSTSRLIDSATATDSGAVTRPVTPSSMRRAESRQCSWVAAP